MKKVIVLTAAVMALSFATPQLSQAMKVPTQMAVVEDKDDKFKEVKVEELPEAVTKSISNAYTGYKIDKAYRGEDNSYKVKVAMGDLKYNLFYDAQGELIKVEDPATSKDEKSLNKDLNKENNQELNKEMEPANQGVDPQIKKSESKWNENETETETEETVPVK